MTKQKQECPGNVTLPSAVEAGGFRESDVAALCVLLRRGAHDVRREDESRHEAQARAVLTSEWLTAVCERERAAEREEWASWSAQGIA